MGPDQRAYKGQFMEGGLGLCDGTFENFVTVNEVAREQMEEELNRGRKMSVKEVKELWHTVDLRKNNRHVEFGRDSFTGTVVDNIFESNKAKQDLIQQLKDEAAKAQAAAQEAEEGA